MLKKKTRKYIWCHAVAPAIKSEPILKLMGEILISLQMRDSTQSQADTTASTLDALCVMIMKMVVVLKHVQT